MRIAYIKAAGVIQRAVRCATGSFENVHLIEKERGAVRERERGGKQGRGEAAGASAVMIVALETRFH